MSPPPIAIAPPLSSLTPPHQIQFFHQRHSFFSPTHNSPLILNSRRQFRFNYGLASRVALRPPLASVSRVSYGEYHNEYLISLLFFHGQRPMRAERMIQNSDQCLNLRLILNCMNWNILFGPSYFSPLLKSVTKRADVDWFMIGEDLEEREDFISMLESRFLFLAADARSTLRGWRPSYRNVLLEVRKRLNIHCSAKLSAEDLEVEIFLHLVQKYSTEAAGTSSSSSSKNSDGSNNLELGLSQWKVQKLAALGIGAPELRSLILKGGGMLTLEKLLQSLGGRLSGKILSEAAKYQLKKEVIRKVGQLASLKLESGVALLAARQGLKAAATRYLGLTSVAQLLGPMMWGTLLADVVIQMLGTDYARILRAIYALAQIRIYRSHINV